MRVSALTLGKLRLKTSLPLPKPQCTELGKYFLFLQQIDTYGTQMRSSYSIILLRHYIFACMRDVKVLIPDLGTMKR